MRCTVRKLRSPLKWHGGKSYLARRIVALLPSHRAYVEPFVGGGSVLLNKPRSAVEVAGDLDPDLVRFWLAVRDDPGRLVAELADVEYREGTFAAADRGSGPVGFLVRNRMSRGGLGECFAWSDRLRGGRPGDLNAWHTCVESIADVAERVASVAFVRAAAADLIRAFDSPTTLTYCDPPYLHSTRTARDAYRYEMTEADHAALLDVLDACRGPVAISGYDSPLYRDRLAGWERHAFEMPNHAGQGRSKQRRLECLWVNRRP